MERQHFLTIAGLTTPAVLLMVYLSGTRSRQSAVETEELAETALADLISVRFPRPNQEVSSPLVVEGMARGCWYFEGDFPVTLIDCRGNVLTRSYASALSEWMTESLVPFRAQLEFTADAATKGVLILHRNNPSGLAEYDERLDVPIVIAKTAPMMTVQVFFSNDRLDPEMSGEKVFAVQRRIPKTSAVARGALEELLKSPTDDEAARNYVTNINPGVKIQRLVIENGIARVDFDERLEFQVGGACRVTAIRAQITRTLKQFSSVNQVIISVNGRTEDVLQP